MVAVREVLGLHADLRDRLENQRGALAASVAGYAEDVYRDNKAGPMLAQVIYNHLRNAPTFHVEPNMSELVLRRAGDVETIRETATVANYSPPDPLGFCVFGKPLPTVELAGRTQLSTAMSWGPVRAFANAEGTAALPGRLVVLWVNTFRHPDDMVPEHIKEFGAKKWAALQQATGGWQITSMDFLPNDMRLGPLMLWPLKDRAERARQRGNIAQPTLNQSRIFAALWELMDETLSTSHTERPEHRADVKWARRARINTDVTVIILRREAQRTLHPGTGKPLEYRTPVKGHPRTYHRGTADEFTIHINPHWRGPEDAPVRQTRKVYNLAR